MGYWLAFPELFALATFVIVLAVAIAIGLVGVLVQLAVFTLDRLNVI